MDVRAAESDVVAGVLHCSGAHHRYSATQRSSVISGKSVARINEVHSRERVRIPKILVPRSNGPLPSDSMVTWHQKRKDIQHLVVIQ
jgi:hypothetical protein